MLYYGKYEKRLIKSNSLHRNVLFLGWVKRFMKLVSAKCLSQNNKYASANSVTLVGKEIFTLTPSQI